MCWLNWAKMRDFKKSRVKVCWRCWNIRSTFIFDMNLTKFEFPFHNSKNCEPRRCPHLTASLATRAKKTPRKARRTKRKNDQALSAACPVVKKSIFIYLNFAIWWGSSTVKDICFCTITKRFCSLLEFMVTLRTNNCFSSFPNCDCVLYNKLENYNLSKNGVGRGVHHAYLCPNVEFIVFLSVLSFTKWTFRFFRFIKMLLFCL